MSYSALTKVHLVRSFFPFLLANIGSGVSVIRVDSPNSYERVSGTAIGGATYYGLCKLLTRCESFDAAMDLAAHGDSRRVNLLVSDIYGEGGYNKVGLSGNMTASFFGKKRKKTQRKPTEKARDAREAREAREARSPSPRRTAGRREVLK